MKFLCLFLLMLLIPLFGVAEEWINIGPNDVIVCNHHTGAGGEMLCTPDGILLYDGEFWNEYSSADLPVWDAEDFDPEGFLVVMGNGSYSDGIYKFSTDSLAFQVIQWFFEPNFIHLVDGIYFVGGFYGVLKSEDGVNWTEVEFFEGKECLAMATSGNHFVVSAVEGVYYSDDNGNNWDQSQNSLYISDMAFHSDGTLYGIYPTTSYSSGLWRSTDYGENWEVEFYSVNMSSVYVVGNHIFVAWEAAAGDSEGVAQWIPQDEELYFMNDGLPNLNINKLSRNTLIDCYNIVCCTQAGAYMTCDIQLDVEDDVCIQTVSDYHLSNFPNPFNPKTKIRYDLPKVAVITLKIYDISGNLVKRLVNEEREAGIHSVIWDGKDERGKSVESGVYIYTLETDSGYSKVQRMTLLK